MSSEQLLRVLGYIWAFFGASWMSFNLLSSSPGNPQVESWRRIKFAFLALTFAVLFFGRHAIAPPIILILSLGWAALGLYWVSSGKAQHSGEFLWYRPLRLLILAITFSLLFWDKSGIGLLGRRFISRLPFLGWLGFTMTIAGLAVALWARVELGRYWSDRVVVQSEHRLIRSGPYSRLRHPIYSGVLLAVLGTGIVLGEWRGLLAFVLLFANYAIKAKREERILAERFGAGFAAHVERTGFLLPRLRGL